MIARLSDMLSGWPEAEQESPLKSFLASFLSALNELPEQEDPKFSVRVKAVCGLQPLAAYTDVLKRDSRFYEHFLGTDPIAAGLTGIRDFRSASCEDIPNEILYTWRGIPFARRGDHDIPPLGIGLDNGGSFPYLSGVRQRCAAKFNDD